MAVKLAFLIQIHLLTNKKHYDPKNEMLRDQAIDIILACIADHYFLAKLHTA
jgi:hypothetical protein